MRRREQSILSNPILIGALTVLATIAAVTLAYQANNGLPFVPKYHLNVQIRNASELTHGAEVHMGGALIGNITSITPGRDAQHQPIAVLKLSLNKTVQPLPVNSTFDVRLKGAIGLKYLEVARGDATKTWPNGATVPVTQSRAEVDLDQVLSMFNPKTQEGIRETTIGFSDALAGRGNDINDAIGLFVPLLRDLQPVATNLASRQTDLGGFFRGLEAFAGATAPAAQTQADLYVNLDTTFRALAPVAVPFLQTWISETPPTFQTVISDSPTLQRFLLNTAGLFSELRPGFATLNQSAPVLADAFAAGTKNLPGTTALDARLTTLAKRLQTYGETPAVNQGLDRLTATVKSLRAPLDFLTPAQSTCNYVSLFLRNTGSSLQENLGNGTGLRFQVVIVDDIPGSEAVPSSSPFLTVPAHSPADHGDNGPLHTNPYPITAAPGEKYECAAGNEPYTSGYLIGNPPGKLPAKTEKTTRPKG